MQRAKKLSFYGFVTKFDAVFCFIVLFLGTPIHFTGRSTSDIDTGSARRAYSHMTRGTPKWKPMPPINGTPICRFYLLNFFILSWCSQDFLQLDRGFFSSQSFLCLCWTFFEICEEVKIFDGKKRWCWRSYALDFVV